LCGGRSSRVQVLINLENFLKRGVDYKILPKSTERAGKMVAFMGNGIKGKMGQDKREMDKRTRS